MARILFIDDDLIDFDPDSEDGSVGYEMGLGLFANALEEAGHEVVRATRAGEALLHIEKLAKFDLMIVDVMMPPEPCTSPFASLFSEESTSNGMGTGFALAEELKNVSPQTPIVFYSNVVVPTGSKEGVNSATTNNLTKRGIVFRTIPKIDHTPNEFTALINQLLREFENKEVK